MLNNLKGDHPPFVEMFNHYMERGGFVERNGHTGIHYEQVFKKESVTEITVTRLRFDDGKECNVVHVNIDDSTEKMSPVLEALGFRRFNLCPVALSGKCMYLIITPDVKWQTSSTPKHMALFTEELMERVEAPWLQAKASWEALRDIFTKYGRELPDIRLLLAAK